MPTTLTRTPAPSPLPPRHWHCAKLRIGRGRAGITTNLPFLTRSTCLADLVRDVRKEHPRPCRILSITRTRTPSPTTPAEVFALPRVQLVARPR